MADSYQEWLEERACEPQPRLHGTYRHHWHRFPIKGGIPRRVGFLRDQVTAIYDTSPLLRHLIKRGASHG